MYKHSNFIDMFIYEHDKYILGFYTINQVRLHCVKQCIHMTNVIMVKIMYKHYITILLID